MSLTTGDRELDSILGGELPGGSLLVLAGTPGTGKTILAQQICFANATAERGALYYTTWSEPHDKLVRHLSGFSFFDESALGERVRFLHLGDLATGEGGLDAVADEILREAYTSRPAVIVIDSTKALHDVVAPDELRRAIYDLASKLSHTDALLIFVGEYADSESRSEPEFAVADGIVQLENEAVGPVDRRWLRVAKLRGAATKPGRHTFQIDEHGFHAFARLETTLPAEIVAPPGRACFGEARLDELTGGGIPRGDSTILLGPTGVGKTLLSLQFLQAGLEAGERCLHVSFQESEPQIYEKAAAAGWDWSGTGSALTVLHVPPVEIDLDVVASRIRAELEREPAARVILDSVAELAFAARQTERLPAYLWSLGGLVRASGGTTIMTDELNALGQSQIGGLSFLFNNVFLLRYVETDSRLVRGINVVKMRQSVHEMSLTEYEIGEGGIKLGPQISGVTGLLGWTALSGSVPS